MQGCSRTDLIPAHIQRPDDSVTYAQLPLADKTALDSKRDLTQLQATGFKTYRQGLIAAEHTQPDPHNLLGPELPKSALILASADAARHLELL